jgi:hypothetical protein
LWQVQLGGAQPLRRFGNLDGGEGWKEASSARWDQTALLLALARGPASSGSGYLSCAEVNVVHVNRMYPRSLLTPFTDNVALTSGDRRVYSRQAKAQRSKGFQHVDVNFDPPPSEPGRDDPGP